MIYFENENFDDIINNGVVVVDFYANWCGPCKILSPTIEKLASVINDVKFVKIDVDKHEDIARKYGIMSIPTLIFFKDGKIVTKHIGLLSEDKIKNIIDDII